MATITPTWGDVFEVPPTTTADDLLRLPDDGSRYELYEGMLVRERTSPGHGDICHRIDGELYVYAKTTASRTASSRMRCSICRPLALRSD